MWRNFSSSFGGLHLGSRRKQAAGGNPLHIQRPLTFLAETQAVTDAATSAGAPISESRALRLNRVITRLKACGAWGSLRALYLVGDDEKHWQINIKSPGVYDLKKVGSPVHTRRVGTTYPTANDYYDTGIPFNTVSQNNVSMFVETNGGTNVSTQECGVQDTSTGGLSLYAWTSGNQITARCNSGPTGLGDTSIANGKGWSGCNRTVSGTFNIYHHGINIYTATKTSQAPATAASILIGKANGSTVASARTIRGFYLGSAMSDAQHQEICAALTDYINSVLYGDPWIAEIGQGDDLIDVDLAIYGLSSSAIMAANEAARAGLSVALIGAYGDETIWDLGGMTTNGLCWIDNKNTSTVSGIFRDAISWIRTVPMGKTDATSQTAFSPEPRWWNAACRRMLDPTRTGGFIPGQDVKVYMTGGLASVVMNDKRISEITTLDARTVSARYFMDASYRGDLLKKAGVPTFTGREPAGTGSEALNGYQGSAASLPQASGSGVSVDPYIVAGNPASGLLPDVQPDPGLADGVYDPAHQAMNYRLTVTLSAEIGRNDGAYPLGTVQPAGYSAARYEKLGRFLAKAPNYDFSSLVTLQGLADGNSVLDLNSGGGFSTDLPGSGQTYAAAGDDLAAVQTAIDDIFAYQIGLFYWLKNSGDARIPAALKSSLNNYALSALNHLDPGTSGIPLGWPKEAYVREPTFMLKNAGFVLDGNDVAMTDGTAPRSIKTISAIAYRSDIHTMRNIAKNGAIYREGGVADDAAGGADYIAPWPLEASLPDKASCENLCTPTAPSMTKIAFAAARMEPSMSAAGQSLAQTVKQAILAGDIALQDVDYATLRAALLSNADATKLALPQTN